MTGAAAPGSTDDDGFVELEGGASPPLIAVEAAEEALVAAVLTVPSCYDDVADVVHPSNFSVPLYRSIWEAVVAADEAGRPIDLVTVTDELEKAGTAKRAGGADGLREICARAAEHPQNVEVYAAVVADRSLLRRVSAAAREIVTHTATRAVDGADALAFAESTVLGVVNGTDREGPVPVSTAVPAMLAELANARTRLLLGSSTGFSGLDRLTGGVQPGQLIIVAGRPGMGKSALAWQLARGIAESSEDAVGFLSYEMSTSELLVRALSSMIAVPLSDLRQGTLPPEAEAELAGHAQRLASLPILIDDRPSPSITGVRSSVRRMARRQKLSAVVIDYLQLMGGDRFGSGQNRTAEVSEISRGLKLLARELDIGVIALSQLNRQVEQRPNKRPMLSDLRESGCLAGDTVITAAAGSCYTLGDLACKGDITLEVLSSDHEGSLRPAVMTRAFSSGVRDVLLVRLSNGCSLRATHNHPVLTPTGWVPVANLVSGDAVVAVDYTKDPVDSITAYVVDVAPDGACETFDATVPETSCFVANGTVVHNSIEQDADTVWMVYRDQVYNPESDPENSELIVVKQRQGGLGTVHLRFEGRYTRFSDRPEGWAPADVPQPLGRPGRAAEPW